MQPKLFNRFKNILIIPFSSFLNYIFMIFFNFLLISSTFIREFFLKCFVSTKEKRYILEYFKIMKLYISYTYLPSSGLSLR